MKLQLIGGAILAVFSILLLSGQTAGSDRLEHELFGGWNATSFVSPPGTDSVPPEVTDIVGFRDGKTLRWSRTKNPESQPILPVEIQEQFADKGALELTSLRRGAGYLIYATQPCKWILTIDSLAPPDTIKEGKWNFIGVPVGGFGSLIKNNEYSPPNFVSGAAVLGTPKSVYYLKKTPAQVTGVTKVKPSSDGGKSDEDKSSHAAEDLKATARKWVWGWEKLDPAKQSESQSQHDNKEPDVKQSDKDWPLKQNEAVWVLPQDNVALSCTMRLLPTSPQVALNAIIVDLGESSMHADVRAKVDGNTTCAFGLREWDWYYSSKKPEAAELQNIFEMVAEDKDFNPSGFTKIEKIPEQPRIEFSHSIVAIPYLETTHGPFSSKRSIRINTERMTKGISGGDHAGSQATSRILNAGFYLSRLKAISTADNANLTGDKQKDLPPVVLMIEVPDLFGVYEGAVTAQVISTRKNGRGSHDPEKFLIEQEPKPKLPLEFSDLIKAARPNPKSIGIGSYPLRFLLSSMPGKKNAIKAVLEKKGSFIVSNDTHLTGSYDFKIDINDFYKIPFVLNEQRKTVFLETGEIVNSQVSAKELPILINPKDVIQRKAIGGGNSTPPEIPDIQIRREIKFLLQEDSAGVLKGVMIERLGRSERERNLEGGVIGRKTKDPQTALIQTENQVIYVLGSVELSRVAVVQGKLPVAQGK